MKRKWNGIILLIIFVLLTGVSGCQPKDNMDVRVEGLRSLVGETVTSASLFNGRESRIQLNENTIIDIQRLDVPEENHIISIIDFAAQNRFEKEDIVEVMQEPFFRQIIEMKYEMLSDTQYQVISFTVDCVPGSEVAKIWEKEIILPEKETYEIGEPVSWNLYVEFMNGSFDLWDKINLECSITLNENGWSKYSISRDANDSLYWESMKK